MKTTAIFVCTTLFVSFTLIHAEDESEGPEGRRGVVQECLKEFGIERGSWREIFHNGGEGAKHNHACARACVFEKRGIMNGTTINADKACAKVQRIVPEEEKENACKQVEQCVAEVAGIEDKCEVAMKFFKCSLPKNPLPRRRFHRFNLSNGPNEKTEEDV